MKVSAVFRRKLIDACDPVPDDTKLVLTLAKLG